jgi:transcriptional regulator with XRE-family HTH domain
MLGRYSMFMTTLGDVIAKRRHEVKRTQRDVAKEAGISAGYLGMIESGKVGIPSPGVMANLARVLGIPEDSLLQSVGYLQSEVDSDDYATVAQSHLMKIASLPTKEDRLSALVMLPRKDLQALVLLMQDLFSTTTPEQLTELIQQYGQDHRP